MQLKKVKVSFEKHALDKVIGGRFQVSQFYLRCITTKRQTQVQHHYQSAMASLLAPLSAVTISLSWNSTVTSVSTSSSSSSLIMMTTVYKCLHGLVPPYLANDCVPVTGVVGRRHLQSADIVLIVLRTRTLLGTSNFAVAGPPVRKQFESEPSLCVRFFADFCREIRDIFVWTAASATEDSLLCTIEMDAFLLLLLFFYPR